MSSLFNSTASSPHHEDGDHTADATAQVEERLTTALRELLLSFGIPQGEISLRLQRPVAGNAALVNSMTSSKAGDNGSDTGVAVKHARSDSLLSGPDVYPPYRNNAHADRTGGGKFFVNVEWSDTFIAHPNGLIPVSVPKTLSGAGTPASSSATSPVFRDLNLAASGRAAAGGHAAANQPPGKATVAEDENEGSGSHRYHSSSLFFSYNGDGVHSTPVGNKAGDNNCVETPNSPYGGSVLSNRSLGSNTGFNPNYSNNVNTVSNHNSNNIYPTSPIIAPQKASAFQDNNNNANNNNDSTTHANGSSKSILSTSSSLVVGRLRPSYLRDAAGSNTNRASTSIVHDMLSSPLGVHPEGSPRHSASSNGSRSDLKSSSVGRNTAGTREEPRPQSKSQSSLKMDASSSTRLSSSDTGRRSNTSAKDRKSLSNSGMRVQFQPESPAPRSNSTASSRQSRSTRRRAVFSILNKDKDDVAQSKKTSASLSVKVEDHPGGEEPVYKPLVGSMAEAEAGRQKSILLSGSYVNRPFNLDNYNPSGTTATTNNTTHTTMNSPLSQIAVGSNYNNRNTTAAAIRSDLPGTTENSEERHERSPTSPPAFLPFNSPNFNSTTTAAIAADDVLQLDSVNHENEPSSDPRGGNESGSYNPNTIANFNGTIPSLVMSDGGLFSRPSSRSKRGDDGTPEDRLLNLVSFRSIGQNINLAASLNNNNNNTAATTDSNTTATKNSPANPTDENTNVGSNNHFTAVGVRKERCFSVSTEDSQPNNRSLPNTRNRNSSSGGNGKVSAYVNTSSSPSQKKSVVSSDTIGSVNSDRSKTRTSVNYVNM